MSFFKVIIGIIVTLAISFCLYILLAFGIKESMFKIYEWHDARYNWLKEYQFVPIKDSYKVIIIIPSAENITDREVSNRFIRESENLGWQTFKLESIEGNEEKIREINPDFIFSAKWDIKLGLKPNYSDYKVYALVSQPTQDYFGGFLSLYPLFNELRYPELKSLSGFIISSPHISLFKRYMESLGKKFYGFQGYASVPLTEYKELEPRKMVYMAGLWDADRRTQKYYKLFKSLANSNLAVFYGVKSRLYPIVENAYRDPPTNSKSIIKEILQEHGINLLLHTRISLESGVPTGRVFETAAAGAIGISDRHPFIVSNFGDSFLYIDVDASSGRILSQLQRHLEWIRDNPDKVKKKTRKAHEIFLENFALESVLLNLAHMHEKILEDEDK